MAAQASVERDEYRLVAGELVAAIRILKQALSPKLDALPDPGSKAGLSNKLQEHLFRQGDCERSEVIQSSDDEPVG